MSFSLLLILHDTIRDSSSHPPTSVLAAVLAEVRNKPISVATALNTLSPNEQAPEAEQTVYTDSDEQL